MRCIRRSNVRRITALLALSALTVILGGSTVGFAAEPDAGGEPCVGCSGCDRGECGGDNENPLTPHHHCCTTCCTSHAPVALSAVASSAAPAIALPRLTPAAPALTAGSARRK